MCQKSQCSDLWACFLYRARIRWSLLSVEGRHVKTEQGARGGFGRPVPWHRDRPRPHTTNLNTNSSARILTYNTSPKNFAGLTEQRDPRHGGADDLSEGDLHEGDGAAAEQPEGAVGEPHAAHEDGHQQHERWGGRGWAFFTFYLPFSFSLPNLFRLTDCLCLFLFVCLVFSFCFRLFSFWSLFACFVLFHLSKISVCVSDSWI